MNKKELIQDTRLTPTMERVRSGSVQMFREPKPDDRSFINRENADVILQHEKKSMYAELIENQWYWVEGCARCKGIEPHWDYVVCEEHDTCVDCGINRKDLNGKIPWGHSKGFRCNDCQEKLDLKIRKEAFEKLDGEEPECDYQSAIICPHCGSELDTYNVENGEILKCDVCEGEMKVSTDIEILYSTEVIGKRKTE